MAAKDWEGGPKPRLYSFPLTEVLGPQAFSFWGVPELISSGEFHSEEDHREDAWQILQYAESFLFVVSIPQCISPIYVYIYL